MGVQNKIEIITNILNFLTWKKLFGVFFALFFSLSLISIAYVWFIDTNHSLNDKRSKLIISNDVRLQMSEINKRSNIIIVLHVITFDFRSNSRIETYTDIDVPFLRDEYDKFIKNRIYETPIFNNDPENNTRVVKILNGEFVCIPFKDTITYKIAPALSSLIADVCYIGIPPYNGISAGSLTFYLQEHPTEMQKAEIFLSARDISIRIFDDNK